MKKLLGVFGSTLLTVALVFGASCGGGRDSGSNGSADGGSANSGNSQSSSDSTNSSNSSGSSQEPEVPVTVHYSQDNREEIYTVYSEADGSSLGAYKSLYQAIEACVDEGDIEDYVTRGTADDTKLFINYDAYSETTTDMFWYYENGTSLDRYTPWVQTYLSDLYTLSSQDVVVFKKSTGEFLPYYQGIEIVGVGNGADATLESWNVYCSYDTNVQVDMEPYSGIVKADYTIKLSEARIRPAYEGEAPVYAKIGFINPDSFNAASYGMYCDTTTGVWYYYYGDLNNADPSDAYDGVLGIDYTQEKIMTSTWDAEEGVWRPDNDIVITGEIVELTDDEGDSYAVDRLTVKDSSTGEQLFTRDYEASAMTLCATMRFNVGLDIYNADSASGLPNYDNGAEFTNIVITSAVGTVTENSADPEHYGNHLSLLTVGSYDLLNSSETASEARYKTYVYNAGLVDYDYGTPGKDVYSFSYNLSQEATEYSSSLTLILNAYDQYKYEDFTPEALASMTEAEKNEVRLALQTAVDTYKKLSKYQQQFLPEDTLASLNKVQALFLDTSVGDFINYINEKGLNDLSGYETIAAVVALENEFNQAKTMYDAIAGNAALLPSLEEALVNANKSADFGTTLGEMVEFIGWAKQNTEADAYKHINFIMTKNYGLADNSIGKYVTTYDATQYAVWTWYTSVETENVFPMASASELSLPAACDVLFANISFQKMIAMYHTYIDTITVMQEIHKALNDAGVGITATIALTGDTNNTYEYQDFELSAEQWAVIEPLMDKIDALVYWWSSVNYDGTATWQVNNSDAAPNGDATSNNKAVWYTGGSDGYGTWGIRHGQGWGSYTTEAYQSAIALLYEITMNKLAGQYGIDWTHGHIYKK